MEGVMKKEELGEFLMYSEIAKLCNDPNAVRKITPQMRQEVLHLQSLIAKLTADGSKPKKAKIMECKFMMRPETVVRHGVQTWSILWMIVEPHMDILPVPMEQDAIVLQHVSSCPYCAMMMKTRIENFRTKHFTGSAEKYAADKKFKEMQKIAFDLLNIKFRQVPDESKRGSLDCVLLFPRKQ